MVPRTTAGKESGRIRPVVVCVVYYEFLGGRKDLFYEPLVRRRTNQPPLTHIIRTTRLTLLGHIARADPSMDHSRALNWASMAPLPRGVPSIRPTMPHLAPDH